MDYLNYEKMVDKALYGVIHDILAQTTQHGLRGNHHFYITFLTGHPEVKIPPYLKEEYQDEITVVLQHQFENLMVSRKSFSVDLFFNNRMETIKVPFEAVISFLDPSVNWRLDFDPEMEDFSAVEMPELPEEEPKDEKTLKKEKQGVVVSLDSFRKK